MALINLCCHLNHCTSTGSLTGTNDGKTIADLHALIAAAVDVNVVAMSKDNFEVGLFAGDDTNFVGDLSVTNPEQFTAA